MMTEQKKCVLLQRRISPSLFPINMPRLDLAYIQNYADSLKILQDFDVTSNRLHFFTFKPAQQPFFPLNSSNIVKSVTAA